MNQHVGARTERLRAATDWVVPVAVALLLVQLAFRAWAAWSGWYLHDDLVLLRLSDEAARWSYLIEPYNGHLMPGGKLVFWAIGLVGSAEWWPAVVYLVSGQAIASSACLWMLVTLFGRRWAILPPFVLYLFLPLSMPAFMWFVAATQQLPLQIVLSISVGAWVRYQRGEGRRWLAVTMGALVAGFFFREKALLVLPVLVFLSLFYFTSGGPRERLRDLRRQALALIVVVGGGVAYVVFYLLSTPSEVTPTVPGLAADLAGTMLGTTLSSGLVGGPWLWTGTSSPNSYANPPTWGVGVAWLVIGVVIVYILLRRRRAWPALLLLAGYVGGTFLLVLSARGAIFGAVLGTDMRYLSDIPIVLCLCVGLATLRLHGAPGTSETRTSRVVGRAPTWVVVSLLAAVTTSGVISSVGYVRPWHDSAAKAYVDSFDRALNSSGRVDLADRVLPDPVMSHLLTPHNRLSFLAPVVTDNARFPDTSSSLFVVRDDGKLRPAEVTSVVASQPGKVAGCGWDVTSVGKTIPLTGRAIDIAWWIRIGYLATAPTTATVTAGDTSLEVSLRQGLNDLFLRVEDGFDEISIDDVQSGVTVCVDTIEVGRVGPGDEA